MNCREVKKNLLAWLEGELDEATWLAITHHVESCEHCQSEARTLKKLFTTLHAIAQNDGFLPVPQRLKARLTKRRVRFTSLVSIFATACLAFLLGWHARGIASSPETAKAVNPQPQQKSVPHATRPDLSLQKVTPCVNFNRTNPIAQTKSSAPKPNLPSARDLTLAFKGATATAVGVVSKSTHNLSTLTSLQEVIDPTKIADEQTEQAISDILWVLIPHRNLQHHEPTPYRIFVQVTDPQTQTIRTVKVDTTESGHVDAEWTEQGM